MAISGNKGEWSEIYTLFRLLGDGKVHAGDANMNKLSLYYPILNIIREESSKFEYKPNTTTNIVVIDENGETYAQIPMVKFLKESDNLLQEIQRASNRAFEVPSTESFMYSIGCTKLKAPSVDKADIHIVIHDLRTNMTPLLGFSIKSQLGSASTLLNAGMTTNFTYLINDCELTDAEIEKINAIKNHLPRMQALLNKGATLQYYDVDCDTFRNNLLFLDCYMPNFIADCLALFSMPNHSSGIAEIVKEIAEKNPFGFRGSDVVSFYAHKMKVLLLDAALGMTPATEWSGYYDANGGYLVVRKDGEIVCYHFYKRNEIEDYLYQNTRFERASRSRYNFGSLYRDSNGRVYMKLNLQIRFKK